MFVHKSNMKVNESDGNEMMVTGINSTLYVVHFVKYIK